MGYEMEDPGENLSAVEIMMSPGKVESWGFKGHTPPASISVLLPLVC